VNKKEKALTKQAKVETKKGPKLKAKVEIIPKKKSKEDESESEAEAAESKKAIKNKNQSKEKQTKKESKSPAKQKAENKKGSKNTKKKTESFLDEEDEEDSDFNTDESDEPEEDYSADEFDEEIGNKKNKKDQNTKNYKGKINKKASLQVTPVKNDKRKQSNDMNIDSAKKNFLNNKNNNNKNNEFASEIDDDELKAIEFAFAEMEKEDENNIKSLRSSRNNNFATEFKELPKEDRKVGLSTTHKKVKLKF
jgi:hypothetical protein